jgi:hypothetical protein
VRLEAPDPSSKRARLADWLEIQALASARRTAALSSVNSILRMVSDDRTNPSDLAEGADDTGDHEITDRAADDLQERVVEEISFRIEKVGACYPFDWMLNRAGDPIGLRLKEGWNDVNSGRLIYVFCLLDSGFREKLIVPSTGSRDELSLVQKIGNVFQICACVAVGGYTRAEVVSFGFPRATGDAFLPALKAAWSRYGSYSVLETIPHGFDTSLQDGGVDIIAWLAFPDGHAATVIMFAQVASGLGWKDKSVVADVAGLRQWFSGTRFESFLPAICIPFPLWFDLEEPAPDELGNPVAFAPGVIFDRGRIAQSAALALGRPEGPPTNIDGIDRIGEVSEWIEAVLEHLIEKRAAA